MLSPAILGRAVPENWQTAIFGGSGIQQQLTEAEQQYEQTLRDKLNELKSTHEDRMARLDESDVSPAATQQAQQQFEQQKRLIQQWLEATGSVERLVSDYKRDYLESLLGANRAGDITQAQQRYKSRRAQLLDARQWTRDRRAASLVIALLLAIGVIMAIEPLRSPQPGAGQRAAIPPALARLKTVRYALLAAVLVVLLARPTLVTRATLLFAGLAVVVALLAGLVPLGRPRSAAGDQNNT